jgi:polar amino acid transport system permease protein
MDWSIVFERLPALAGGLLRTLMLFAISALAALTLGGVLTLAHMRGRPLVRLLVHIYTALCLGLPLLIVIYILFYALPGYGVVLSSQVVGVLALAIYYGPYFAEVMRAAVQAIPVGQSEAASAIGLSRWRTARRIILPLALPLMLPSLAGLMIGMIKDSALLSVVSVPEFMFFAKEAVSETYAPIEIYVAVALTYWVLSASSAVAARWMERRLTAYTLKLA